MSLRSDVAMWLRRERRAARWKISRRRNLRRRLVVEVPKNAADAPSPKFVNERTATDG